MHPAAGLQYGAKHLAGPSKGPPQDVSCRTKCTLVASLGHFSDCIMPSTLALLVCGSGRLPRRAHASPG